MATRIPRQTTRGRGRVSLAPTPSTRRQPATKKTPTISAEAQEQLNKERMLRNAEEAKARLTLRRQIEDSLPKLEITGSVFRLLSYEQLVKVAGDIRITDPDYTSLKPYTVNDSRMGGDTELIRCETCELYLPNCYGHMGMIDFGVHGNHGVPNRIPHPLFIRQITQFLNVYCSSCSELIVSDTTYKETIKPLAARDKLRQLEKVSTNIRICPHCGVRLVDFTVGKDEKNKEKEYGIIYCEARYTDADRRKLTPEEKEKASRKQANIESVYHILNNIKPKNLEYAGMPPDGTHPRDFILRALQVVPPRARPTIRAEGAVYPDFITLFYSNMVKVVNKIKETTTENQRIDAVRNVYKTFYDYLFTPSDKKVGRDNKRRAWHEIVSGGKQSIFRVRNMGKRALYCSRSVIEPGCSLEFGEFGVPDVWASELTAREITNSYNRDYLLKLINAGKVTNIVRKATGISEPIVPGRAYTLDIGDEVNRHLTNADILYLNRQPTLSYLSYLSGRVVLVPSLAILLQLCYTTSFNADFDGDEANLTSGVRDPYVRAEAELITSVTNNPISASTNKPTMGLVQNSIVGAYLMSHPERDVDEMLYHSILQELGRTEQYFDIMASKCIFFGKRIYAGSTLLSFLFPEDFSYTHAGVIIINGLLVNGRLTKKHVGPEHRSIIQALSNRPDGERYVETFLTHAPWMINKWLSNIGFTVGLLDIVSRSLNVGVKINDDPALEIYTNVLTQIRQDHINDPIRDRLDVELAQGLKLIESLGPAPKDEAEARKRENAIRAIINSIQTAAITITEDVLRKAAGTATGGGLVENALASMYEPGSKGTVVNPVNMAAMVGQQYVGGQRIKSTAAEPSGLAGRTLPHFKQHDLDPTAQGLVTTNYLKGLDLPGMFYSAITARDAAAGTVLDVAIIGDLLRKLCIALAAIVINIDGSIRNTQGYFYSPSFYMGYAIQKQSMVRGRGGKEYASPIDLPTIVRQLNNMHGWYEKPQIEVIKKEREKTKSEKISIRRVARLVETFPVIRGMSKEEARSDAEQIETALDIKTEKLSIPPYRSGVFRLPEIREAEGTEEELTREELLERYPRPFVTIERKQEIKAPTVGQVRPLTIYEKTRIIGSRMADLEQNAVPFVWMSEVDRRKLLDEFAVRTGTPDYYKVAKYEYDRGALGSYASVRTLPGGKTTTVPANVANIVHYSRPKITTYLPIQVVMGD